MNASVAEAMEESRKAAVERNEQCSSLDSLRIAVLEDKEGLQEAIAGALYFLAGGPGYEVEGLPNVHFSPSAAKVAGLT